MQLTVCPVAIAWLCFAVLTGGCWKMQQVWIGEEDAGETDSDTVAGVVVDAVKAGGGGEDTSLAIAALPDGSCYITGYIKLAATFGPGDPNETVLTPQGSAIGDIYLARYNPDLTLAWVVLAGGAEGDAGLAVTALSDDSAVIAGYYRDSATFGADEPHETTLEGVSQQKAIHVARYESDGELIWAKRAFSDDTGAAAEVRGIAALPDDSVVVTGWFLDNVTFGPGEPEQTTLYTAGPPGNTNGFIARYADDGSLVWVRRFGSDGTAVGNAVSAGETGAIYAVGHFGLTITFGSGSPESVELTAMDSWDAFLVRYSQDGAPQWAVAARGNFDLVGRAVAAMPGGGAFAAGYFQNAATFGLDEPAETTLQAQGMRDLFSAGFEDDGQLVFAVKAGGGAADSETDVGRACAALEGGGGLTTGWFSGTAVFDADQESEEGELISGGSKDAFVARYGPQGQLEWVRQLGGPGEDRGYGLAPLGDGTFLVTGSFRGSVTFEEEDELVPEITLQAQGNSDIFLARYLL